MTASSSPTAMKHPKTGNILTIDDKINEVAVDVFSERLESAPIKKELEHIKDAKEILCEMDNERSEYCTKKSEKTKIS